MKNPMSGLSFKVMSLGFKVRDLLQPRSDVLKESGIEPGSVLLDFGCGPGGYVAPLAESATSYEEMRYGLPGRHCPDRLHRNQDDT